MHAAMACNWFPFKRYARMVLEHTGTDPMLCCVWHGWHCRDRPDVAMQLVAVDFLPPSVLHSQLMRVSAMMAAGQLQPLCQATYSLSSVVAAMRLLAQASHIGKVRAASMAGSSLRGACGCACASCLSYKVLKVATSGRHTMPWHYPALPVALRVASC